MELKGYPLWCNSPELEFPQLFDEIIRSLETKGYIR